MREILFRGIRVDNGEWVYGNIITRGEFYYITPINGMVTYQRDCGKELLRIHNWYQVIAESVGQFTGLKDKNGVKIFEGDIITYFLGRKAIIKFGDYMVDGEDYYSNFTQAGFYGEYIIDGETTGLKGNICGYDIEVIGNIYEHAHLLET